MLSVMVPVTEVSLAAPWCSNVLTEFLNWTSLNLTALNVAQKPVRDQWQIRQVAGSRCNFSAGFIIPP